MTKHWKKAAIALVLPLAAACASDGTEGTGPDWSKSTTYNVTTARSDRVTVRVVGTEKDGYEYNARIRHTTRSDPDPLDRQRVLREGTQSVVAKLCPKGGNETRPRFSANNYEQRGRFVCSVK